MIEREGTNITFEKQAFCSFLIENFFEGHAAEIFVNTTF